MKWLGVALTASGAFWVAVYGIIFGGEHIMIIVFGLLLATAWLGVALWQDPGHG